MMLDQATGSGRPGHASAACNKKLRSLAQFAVTPEVVPLAPMARSSPFRVLEQVLKWSARLTAALPEWSDCHHP